ncbi:phage holin family protein [Patescibacteria group bacterium]|nr:phage holin family protein [Patescibacteria group bacterium]MBU1876754.1 phage holin family protein [Patescibacteria group bacterium]
MLGKLIFKVITGALGIFLAVHFISGVSLDIVPGQSEFFGIVLTERWQLFIAVGLALGLLNIIVKPILSLVTLPLQVLTLGFFGLVINMIIIWITDVIFPELVISGITPLFWTSLIIWGVNFVTGAYK